MSENTEDEEREEMNKVLASFSKEKWKALLHISRNEKKYERFIIGDKMYHVIKYTWKHYLFHWVICVAICAAICVAICAASYWVSKAFTSSLINIAIITATFVILSLFIICSYTRFLWKDSRENLQFLKWLQYLSENNITPEEYFKKADEDFRKFMSEITEPDEYFLTPEQMEEARKDFKKLTPEEIEELLKEGDE